MHALCTVFMLCRTRDPHFGIKVIIVVWHQVPNNVRGSFQSLLFSLHISNSILLVHLSLICTHPDPGTLLLVLAELHH